MYARHLEQQVVTSLRDTPVVLVNGARQTGKTTLVRKIVSGQIGWRYVTLDDASTMAAALADPTGFVRDLGARAAIDEIQKVPSLLSAIKVSVDERRAPGRFLLTGSADVLTMPAVSESLAGRMEPRTLWPLSQGEVAGEQERFVSSLFAARPSQGWSVSTDRTDVLRRALHGGYPAAFRRSEARRRDWFAAYVTTIVQRDIRDLADVQHAAALPRVLSLIAARAGGLLNASELSRTSGLPLTTLQRYLGLLEQTFLLRLIRPWSTNRSKRITKTSKVALVDPALLAHLAGITSARLRREPDLAGPLLETFVATEIWKQMGWSRVRAELFHFRTHAGREVDLVLEADDGRVVGVEVKAAATVHRGDFRGLETLREVAGPRFHRGVVLHTGSERLAFGTDMMAVPIGAVWGTMS